MQQRGVNSDMDIESEENTLDTRVGSAGRHNSKLKVLVRSHAMREETSPPREPTPTALNSPCIKLTPSSDCASTTASSTPSPKRPILVLSPSASNSPSHSPNLSPTNTLVPSPKRYSPLQQQQQQQQQHETEFNDASSGGGGGGTACVVTTKYYNNKQQRPNVERFNTRNLQKNNVIVEECHNSSSASAAQQPSSCKCECVTTCTNCHRNQSERNHNNNLSSLNNNNNNNNFNTTNTAFNNNLNNNNTNSGNITSNTLTVNRANNTGRGKLKQQSSSQGSFDSNSPCLSRDNSAEQYTDTTGVDLELFIPETLNRNAKDRALMLRIEEELVQLAKDKGKTHFKFPPMSSYQRMLVHRCAAYFGMDHNIESSGKCVVVNKTKCTRIPDVEFKQHLKEDVVFSEEPRRSILKRDSNSIEDYSFKSPDRQYSLENRRSKSIEEREEEYVKARRRIFNKEDCEHGDDMHWPELWTNADSDNLAKFRLHAEHHGSSRNARLLKVQSEETGEETLRPCVAKSYSFGGYGGVLTRGDSVMSTHSAGPRLLTKQDSAASSVSWRLSPSSSGYKTQSQRSESVTPSPTSTPYLSGDSARQDSTNSTATNMSDEHDMTNIVWAVTNISSVPKGSMIINPQNGQPFKNDDGSVYHYDPDHLLPEIQHTNSVTTKPPPSPTKSSPQHNKVLRERPPSPKHKRTNITMRSSPVKKTNSATSPSLPFTPPIPPQRNYYPAYVQNTDALSMHAPPPTQQQYIYGPSYTPDGAAMQMYQPQCIVFAPYGTHVPVGYDGRLDPQVQEVASYYNIQDVNAQGQQLTYQANSTLWNQQPMTFYQSSQPPVPGTRFTTVPLPPPPQQNAYMSPYPTNFIPPQPPPPQPTNPEMISMYSQQPVPILYPQPQPPPPPPNQTNYPPPQPPTNIVFSQQTNSSYPNSGYPSQTSIPYPPNTPTPSSCTSSVSNTPFHNQVYDPSIGQVVQGMTQMQLAATANSVVVGKQHHQQAIEVANNKCKNAKGVCSSQSSTENSSPAMTVIAGYCQNNQGYYRQTSETPPTSSSYGGNFMTPMFIRPMNNVRASPPVTSRSSRSPTPASETHIDRQRFSLPPLVYQGMPYPMQSDNRIVSGRGQPTAYRQAPIRHQSNPNQSNETKNYKNKRSRGNKASSLPPNGRQ